MARFGTVLLATVCASAAGDAATAPTLSPAQVVTAADNIRPAMDLLLAPLDHIFADGFE